MDAPRWSVQTSTLLRCIGPGLMPAQPSVVPSELCPVAIPPAVARRSSSSSPLTAGETLRNIYTTPMPMALHGTDTRLRCRWFTTGLTHDSDADGSPRDLHTTPMPMVHHRTYTRLRCRWLTIGLTHDSDADGSPWDLHTAPMPMAHHGTDKLHGCRWLTIGLARNPSVDSSSRDLHTTRMTYT